MNENNTKQTTENRDMCKGLKEISALLAKVNDADLIWDFFECLFTEAERRDFSNRWLLVKEISNGVPQREISQKYGLSLCKITRGSRELKKDNSAFVKMLELQKKETESRSE